MVHFVISRAPTNEPTTIKLRLGLKKRPCRRLSQNLQSWQGVRPDWEDSRSIFDVNTKFVVWSVVRLSDKQHLKLLSETSISTVADQGGPSNEDAGQPCKH